ncbi:hypothetical protein pb186bvf_002817 [Paramecium bursaria]
MDYFIFPAPTPFYKEENFKELIWIYHKLNNRAISTKLKECDPQQEDPFELEDNTQTPTKINRYITSSLENLKLSTNLYSSVVNNLPKPQIIQHPKNRHQSQYVQRSARNKDAIPCLYIDNKRNKILIYFHANGEDLYKCYELVCQFGKGLDVNVIAVEYPGYGVYQGKPNEKQILSDADTVFNYVKNKRFNEESIIICGRSIGTGPACYLASKHHISNLILISPFYSLKQLIQDKFGSIMSAFIQERFPNFEYIQQVKSPTFILHGISDEIIPVKHSQMLAKLNKARTRLITPKNFKLIQYNNFYYL